MAVRHSPKDWLINPHHINVKEIPEKDQHPRQKQEGYGQNLSNRQNQAHPAQPTKALHKGPTKPKGGGETFQKDLADRKIGTYKYPHYGSASRFA